MARAEFSVVINRPVEDVFAVISNPNNNPKWQSGTLEGKQTSPGPIGVGTTVRFVRMFLGRRIENEQEITEFEPNRRFAAKGTKPFPGQMSVTVERIEGGTRVRATMEAEPSGFFKLAEPLVIRVFKRQIQSDFENLKDLMEASAL